ncbi:MAG: amino acid permease, partial [Gemmatimonadetes bacterium]|nr:amino acid permease [Gemmatimonadota bacterium]
ILFVYAIPAGKMEGVVAVGGLAAERLFGAAARTVFSGLIGFALLSSISAMIMLGPRVYYAMARDGYFFRFVAAVHPDTHVPTRSIVLQSLIAVALVLSGTFDQILTWMGFCLGIFPVLAVLGVFRLRRSGRSLRRMPGFPVTPFVFAAGSVLILVLAWLERPVESTIAILTVMSGIPFWFLFERRRRS